MELNVFNQFDMNLFVKKKFFCRSSCFDTRATSGFLKYWNVFDELFIRVGEKENKSQLIVEKKMD